jgi:hypothetical protein
MSGPALCVLVLPAALWSYLAWCLVRLRRRRAVARGTWVVFTVTGVAANLWSTLSAFGAAPPWLLVPLVCVAVVTGYGFMGWQLWRHRGAVFGPWPDPARPYDEGEVDSHP